MAVRAKVGNVLLLDTCAILWLASDQGRLSPRARAAIAENGDALFASSISAFEIAVKARSKKLDLPVPPEEWYRRALDVHGIAEIPLAGATVIRAAGLPLLHRDPCDRFIIAAAEERGMKIVTCDQLIAQYKEARVVW
jgi:PIN domain nuclease of toxin-antitoxin system